jgi:glycosyltransferase involved in cell wall biosynthesis
MTSIFFISLMNGAAWGGSEELWYRTAFYALEKGHKVGCAVYAWTAKENKLRQLEDAGAKVFRLPNGGVEQNTFLQKLQFKLNKKFFLRKAIKKLPLDHYDVTVVNLGEFENTHGSWKNLHKKTRHLVTLYHNYREGQRLKPDKAAIMQDWVNTSKLNLFASSRIRQVLEELSGVQITRHAVLLNPISFDRPEAFYFFPSLREGNYIFLMLAALDVSRKAQDQMIKAFSSDKWKGRNWQLHLYGTGKDMNFLQSLIADCQLQDKVFLKGHTSDVEGRLKESHLLLQLTHVDAMPLSVVEAMAVGRPVVVSNIGDMPGWVKENENGWISEDASVKAIDSTMEKAWSQREHWGIMGKKAFEIFNEKYPASPEHALLKRIEAVAEEN